jgi:hypothetical protein
MRQRAAPRMTFATSPGSPRARGDARAGAARERTGRGWRVARLALAILASPLLALAGIAYVVLLPVCGIASLLEGLLGAAWNWVRTGAQEGAATRRSSH